MGRTKAAQFSVFYPSLIHGLPKTSHEACATPPKKSPCPPSIPRSRTAKVPIVLLGMCTGMVRLQAQQRPCRRPGHVEPKSWPQIIQNYTRWVSTLKPRFWGIFHFKKPAFGMSLMQLWQWGTSIVPVWTHSWECKPLWSNRLQVKPQKTLGCIGIDRLLAPTTVHQYSIYR